MDAPPKGVRGGVERCQRLRVLLNSIWSMYPKKECWVKTTPGHPPGTGRWSDKSKYMWVLLQKALGFATEKRQKHVKNSGLFNFVFLLQNFISHQIPRDQSIYFVESFLYVVYPHVFWLSNPPPCSWGVGLFLPSTKSSKIRQEHKSQFTYLLILHSLKKFLTMF